MSQALNKWQAAGAKRFMDFRELAAALCCRLELRQDQGSLRLKVTSDGAVPLVRPLVIALRSRASPLPVQIDVEYDGRSLALPVRKRDDRFGCVELPVGESALLNR